MSNDTVKIGIDVSSNGTMPKSEKEAAALNKQLEALARSAERANKATQGGGTPGSRKASASMDTQGYRNLQGTAQTSGAEARDFAKQSQGLGGLVRVYATFAANLFAVSAAFNALKQAADTSGLVKGLDMLGAAQGRNLGGLSKRLVEITDGAISMRDAMTSVAQTTSGGMNAKNVERLALVAKNASLALGISMPDAISRLSRGITKLEPELLDELGIMTKIEPAVETYARSVGKAASQLTDFERRQAFANAVLLEGESKFGALGEAASNPYDRLLASLKNVAQTGLEFINKFLTPVISLLATSPVALAAAIGTIGTVLLKQALPALGQFKKELADSAERANALAGVKAKDAKAARAKLDKEIESMVERSADVQIQKLAEAEKKIQDLSNTTLNKRSAAYKLMSKDLQDITAKDLARLETTAKGLETKGLKAEAAAYRELKLSVEDAQKAWDAEQKAKLNARNAAEKDISSKNTIIGLNQKLAQSAEIDSFKKVVVSNAAYNASLIGITGAFKLMRAELAESTVALTKWQKTTLYASASFAMIGGVLSTVASAFQGVFMWIGIIVTALGLLDSWASKNAKEMEDLSRALDMSESSAKNAANTLDLLNKKGGVSTATIDGINAMANALNDLTGAAEASTRAMDRAKAAQGTWDKIKDSIFSFFGGGLDKNLAKALSLDVEQALKILRRSGISSDAEKTFKEILNVDTLDLNTVREGILRLSDAAKEDLVKALQKANTELNNASSRLQGFKSATEAVKKAYDEYIQSTANTNPIFKVGAALESLGQSMSLVANGGVRELEAAMLDLAKSPEKVALFGANFTQKFIDVREGFLEQTKAVEKYKNEIIDLAERQEVLNAKLKAAQTRGPQVSPQQVGQVGAARDIESRALKEDLKNLQQQSFRAQIKLSELPTDKIAEARKLFTEGIGIAFTKGAELVRVALGQASEKAGLTVAKAMLGGLSGANRAQLENTIATKEIQIQLKAIDTNIDLILTNERLIAAIDTASIKQDAANAIAAGKPEANKLETAAKASEIYKGLIDSGPRAMKSFTGAGLDQDVVDLVRARLIGTNQRLGAQYASRIEVQGQLKAQQVTGARGISKGELEDQQKAAEYAQAINNALAARETIINTIAGINSAASITEQNRLDTIVAQKRQEQEIRNIDNDIKNAATDAEGAKLGGYKNSILIRQEQERQNAALQLTQKYLELNLTNIGKRYDLEKQTRDLVFSQKDAELEISSTRITSYAQLYDAVGSYVNRQRYSIELQKAELDQRKVIGDARAEYDRKEEESKARIAALGTSDTDGSKAKAITDELARQAIIRDNAILQAGVELDKRTQIAAINKAVADEQQRYNDLLKTGTDLATSLAAAFGEVGATLGTVVKSISEFVVASEKGAKAQQEIAKAMDEAERAGNYAKLNDLSKDYAKQEKDNVKTQVQGYATIAGAAKSLFSERSQGAKILGTIEKALHIQRLGTMAEEVLATTAGEAAKTAAAGAGYFSRMGIYISEIYAKFAATLGPYGIAAAAAVIAAIGLRGGSTQTSAAFAMNSEQRQETQGTGTTYDANGNKIETGGGVFGDSSAKVDNINSSLEIIKNNSVEGLNYDNKLLKSFERVANAMTGAAQAIYTVPGLRKGGNFGTQSGTTSTRADQTINGALVGALLAGPIGAALGGALSQIPLVGNILGGIFGGGTSATTSIEGAGIQLRGSLEQIIDDTAGSIMQYKDVLQQFHKDGGWFGSDEDWTQRFRQVNTVKEEVTNSIIDVFKQSKIMFIEVGESAGITAERVQSVFENLNTNIDIDLQGLTGDKIVAELNAVIGSKLDEAAKVLFSSFDKYKKFGESYLTTVVRVVDTNTKVQQVLTNIGIDKLVKGLYDITEGMITTAGGLENFISEYDFFRTNFLSESEQLVPVQKAVTEELKRLNITTVTSREGFVALIRSLDVTTQTGRNTYQALMNLAPGIDQVFKAEEKVAEQRQGLQKKILELEGDTLALRNKELDALDASNQALQKQIWALGEQQIAAKNLKSNLEGVTKTIKSQITSLTEYKNTLLTGDKSSLTTSQQYQSAKDDITNLLAVVNGIPKTKEEEDARNIAIGKLSGSTDRFLALSRELFASGAQYTADFNTVLSIINQTSSSLSTQLSTAELQLTTLKTSESYLFNIEASSKTTAELMQEYLDATALLRETGYTKLATGTNYVPQDMTAQIHKGERIIPAADNFVLMSRLSTTDNYTRDMCIQIRELNQKIESLERTVAEGAVMNAQATDRNTEQIAQAVTDGSDKTVQVTRIQNKATIK